MRKPLFGKKEQDYLGLALMSVLNGTAPGKMTARATAGCQ
jgi:hypothetical protein